MVAELQPHRSRYWLNAKAQAEDPVAFTEAVETICTVYAYAPMLEALGCHVVSTDEMTGIQALERAAPTKPMRSGCPERREHEYIRHGTTTLNRELQRRHRRGPRPHARPQPHRRRLRRAHRPDHRHRP